MRSGGPGNTYRPGAARNNSGMTIKRGGVGAGFSGKHQQQRSAVGNSSGQSSSRLNRGMSSGASLRPSNAGAVAGGSGSSDNEKGKGSGETGELLGVGRLAALLRRRKPSYISVGCDVTLMSEEEQEDGFFAFGNDTDRSMVKTDLDVNCVFTIEPMTQYTARKALRHAEFRTQSLYDPKQIASAVDHAHGLGGLGGHGKDEGVVRRRGMTGDFAGGMGDGGISIAVHEMRDQFLSVDATSAGGAEMRNLGEYLQIEEASNKLVREQLAGKVLLYGQIIHLFHARTAKLVAAKPRDLETFAKSSVPGVRRRANSMFTTMAKILTPAQLALRNEVRLEKEGSRRILFKVLPHSGRVEGDVVEEGDQIRLQHVRSGLFLHQSKQLDEDFTYEVHLSEEPTAWTIGKSKLGVSHRVELKDGNFVRFENRTAGHVRCSGSVVSSKVSNSYGRQSHSFRNIWQVEQAAKTDTGQIFWSMPVRFKLLGSNVYLTHSHGHGHKHKHKHEHVSRSSPGDLSGRACTGSDAASVADAMPAIATDDRDADAPQTRSAMAVGAMSGDPSDHMASTTSDERDPRTLFAFVRPADAPSDELGDSKVVFLGAQVFIKAIPLDSSTRERWLHCSAELFTRELQDRHSQVVCSIQRKEDDYFQLQGVETDQMDRWFFVRDSTDVLKQFLSEMLGLQGTASRPNTRSLNRAIAAIADMTRFCSASNEEDALKREGIPIKGSQALLYATSRDVIFDVLNWGVERWAGIASEQSDMQSDGHDAAIKEDVDQVERARTAQAQLGSERGYLGDLLMHVYRLIRALCRSNPTVSLQCLQRYYETLISPPSEFWVFCLQALIAIYRDNELLLDDLRLEIVRVETIVSKFKAFMLGVEHVQDVSHPANSRNRHPLFLEFLRTLVSCHGVRNAGNQNLVTQILDRNRDALLYTRVNNKKRCMEILAWHPDKGAEAWTPLRDFVYQVGGRLSMKNLVDYYLQQLLLLSQICTGRNYHSIEFAMQWVGHKHAFSVLRDEDFDNAIRFREAYCDILHHVFTDCHPYQSASEARLVWSFDQYSVDDNPFDGLVTGFDHILYPSGKEEPLGTATPAWNPNAQRNQESFLLHYVCRPGSFAWDPTNPRTQNWSFFLSVLKLVRTSFQYGAFKLDSVHLMHRFREILEMQMMEDDTEVGLDLARSVFISASKHSPGNQRAVDHIILMNVKLEICKIISIFFDFQQKRAFEHFMRAHLGHRSVKKASSVADIKAALGKLASGDGIKLGVYDQSSGFDLASTLMKLIKHENNALTSLSMRLLVRIRRGPLADLLTLIGNCQILTLPLDISVFKLAEDRLKSLVEQSGRRMSRSEQQDVRSILDFFVATCEGADAKALAKVAPITLDTTERSVGGVDKATLKTSRTTAFSRTRPGHGGKSAYARIPRDPNVVLSRQSMLAAASVHAVILRTLHIPLDAGFYKGEDLEGLVSIFRSCFEFLERFCSGNSANQHLLFPHVPLLLEHMGRDGDSPNVGPIVGMLTAIFRGNPELCGRVTANGDLARRLGRLVDVQREEVQPSAPLRFGSHRTGDASAAHARAFLSASRKQQQRRLKEIGGSGSPQDALHAGVGFELLKTLVMPSQSQVVRANQTLVLKVLLGAKSDPLHALATFKPLRASLKEAAYVARLVPVVAACASGHNEMAKSLCRLLFSPSDAITVLKECRQTSFLHVEGAFSLLFDEVFLGSDDPLTAELFAVRTQMSSAASAIDSSKSVSAQAKPEKLSVPSVVQAVMGRTENEISVLSNDDTEEVQGNRALQHAVWEQIAHYRDRLRAFLATQAAGKTVTGDLTAQYILSILSFIDDFFFRHVSVDKFTKTQVELVSQLIDTVADLVTWELHGESVGRFIAASEFSPGTDALQMPVELAASSTINQVASPAPRSMSVEELANDRHQNAPTGAHLFGGDSEARSDSKDGVELTALERHAEAPTAADLFGNDSSESQDDGATSDISVPNRRDSPPAAQLSAHDLDDLLARLKAGVVSRDRKWAGRKFRMCFTGKDAVSFLTENRYASTRDQAVALGAQLEARGDLFHVTRDHKFKDASFFYQFANRHDEPKSRLKKQVHVVEERATTSHPKLARQKMSAQDFLIFGRATACLRTLVETGVVASLAFATVDSTLEMASALQQRLAPEYDGVDASTGWSLPGLHPLREMVMRIEFQAFIGLADLLAARLQYEENLDQMLKAEDPSGVRSRVAALARLPSERVVVGYIEVMVFQLRNVLHHDNELKFIILRILGALLSRYRPDERAALQRLLQRRYDAAQAVLPLLGSSSPEIVRSAMEFLLLLVNDTVDDKSLRPNGVVQRAIVEHFTSRPDESFFENIYVLIQKTKASIKNQQREGRRVNSDNGQNFLTDARSALSRTVSVYGRSDGNAGIRQNRVARTDLSPIAPLLADGIRGYFDAPLIAVAAATEDIVESKQSTLEAHLIHGTKDFQTFGARDAPGSSSVLRAMGAAAVAGIGLVTPSVDNVGTIRSERSEVDSGLADTHVAGIVDGMKLTRALTDSQDGASVRESLLLHNVLLLLQLMCRPASGDMGNFGQQHLVFRNYARVQPDNFESFDIVKELVLFVKVVQGISERHNQQLVMTLFSTLNEISRDSALNKLTIVEAQLLTPVNSILAVPDLDILMRVKILEFLLHLVQEPSHPRIFSKMVSTLNHERLLEFTEALNAKENVSDSHIALASLCFNLLKVLCDSRPATHQRSALDDTMHQVERNCRKRIGRVEIVYDGVLERVYFPIPSIFNSQKSKRAREQIINSLISRHVDWSQAADKLEGFVRWTENHLVGLEHRNQIERSRYQKFLLKHESKWRNLSFLCACVINLLLLAYVENKGFEGMRVTAPIAYQVVFWLGLFQTLTSAFLVSSFFLSEGEVIRFRRLKNYADSKRSLMLEHQERRTAEIKEHIQRSLHSGSVPRWIPRMLESFVIKGGYRLTYASQYVLAHLRDFSSLFMIFYLAFSILGNVITPFFFAYHLFQSVIRSYHLRQVVTAIRLNLLTMSVMMLFILQVLYIFGIASISWFSHHYDSTQGAYCDSLLQCIVTNLYYGIPSGGGIFEFVEPLFWPNSWDTFFWTTYVTLFFVIFGIILLNVFLAIIVDTFGQLRDRKADADVAQSSQCFVCSIGRDTFKRVGHDFNNHVKTEHNLMHYVYFFAYLKEAKKAGTTEFAPLERWVIDQIYHNSFINIFPIERALALEGDFAMDDPQIALMQKVDELEELVLLAGDRQEQAMRDSSSLRNFLASLQEQMNHQKQAHDSRDSYSTD